MLVLKKNGHLFVVPTFAIFLVLKKTGHLFVVTRYDDYHLIALQVINTGDLEGGEFSMKIYGKSNGMYRTTLPS